MQRRKPLREKRKKGKLRNKMIYGIVAIGLIFICFLAYSLLHTETPLPDGNTSSPKATLVDHLSLNPQTKNETFKEDCRTILEDAGFDFTYYGGEQVTIDFYTNLPTQDYKLILLRVHSATIQNETSEGPFLGLFTSEIYNETTEAKYRNDLETYRLAIAFFTEGGPQYLGITEWFVRDRMIGTFKNTSIIMMGCEGLNHTTMAEEFHQKGAKVYISWTGPVAINHTDDSTIRLLQSLLQQNQTIKTAVEGISSDPTWTWSKLDYYPKEVGNDFISYLTLGVTDMGVICYKVCLFSSSNRFKAMKQSWSRKVFPIGFNDCKFLIFSASSLSSRVSSAHFWKSPR